MNMSFKSLPSFWKDYNKVSSLLAQEMGGTANIIGEFAERLVAEYLHADLLPTSNKSADLKTPDGKQIQVKSRRLKALKSSSLGIIRSWDFDILVVVLFSEEGNVLKGIKINTKDAQALAVSNDYQNGDILITNNELLNHPNAIDITSDLQALL